MSVTVSRFVTFAFHMIRTGIFKFIPFPISLQTVLTRRCSLETMTGPNWSGEKEKIMKLPIEAKRKLYPSQEYFYLDKIEPWDVYVRKNPTIEAKKHSLDDIKEFEKIKLDPELNKDLSGRVSIFKGDITKLEIDAIVNAANSRLKAGGGVDGAIHRAAGTLLQQECDTLNGCATGDAKITGGYRLPAKYVIHTVGPQDGSEARLLSCYEKCFSIQKELGLKSIAFPCISTGIYGFPNRLAAHIALRTARKALENDKNLERVIFCLFMAVDVEIYETLMQMYFPVREQNLSQGASVSE